MSNEIDMSEYLDLFLQESEEQLEILEQETLKLEKDPSQDRLQIIFRAAHTLKGSSRAMGFTSMAELTHEMENVLDQLRGGLLSVNTQIADALLNCLDTLLAMAESIRAGTGDGIECAALIATLQGISGGATGGTAAAPAPATFQTQLDPDAAEALREAATQGTIFHGRFRLSADCVMKYVRVFMLTSMVEEAGELLVCIPDREKLEEEQFDHTFELFFQSNEPLESLQATMQEVSELEWMDLSPWTGEFTDAVEETPEVAVAAEPEATSASPTAIAPVAAASDSAATNSAAKPTTKSADSGQTVRVDVARLDNLMNLVGELVIDRTRIAQIGADLSARYEDSNIDALAETVGHIARITGDLQDQIMKARMMPIETVFNRFPRVIRDLAQKLGKDVNIQLEGGDTELDRSVIEVIGDPLLHILRNSIDHGLEMPDEREAAGKDRQGNILVTARHQENHIVIEIIDDGRGIDASKIKKKAIESGVVTKDAADRMSEKDILMFIFASGFSTATEVSEVSGRGVGMDIVRSNLQKLGGIVELETEVGKGTKFSLRLPLTLAIIRGLLVKVSGVVYVVPLGSVVETLLVEKSQIQFVNKQEVIVIRGTTTPLMRMRQVFTCRNFVEEEVSDELYVVIVGLAEQRMGLVVDRLVGEQEVVIKSLSRYCGEVKGVSGATILGDGNVALIMDVNGLVTK